MYKNDNYSPSELLYGRRCSRSLSESHVNLIKNHLPTWKIDIDFSPPAPLEKLFPIPVNEVRLEIGFGRGEHLIKRSSDSPNAGFIGVEPFINSMAQCIKNLEQLKLRNVLLYDKNVIHLLDWLPNDCIDVIYLLYPDPWIKKKHWKRRLISLKNLDRFARVLKKGGMFYFASDISHYVNWTLLYCCNHSSFQWIAEDSSDWMKSFSGWITTYYEEKAKYAGRNTAYLSFKRV
ncbi:MAG: tRNA (guanosine(46)-N7)-methyltransferase TrmB [Candidatus Liberibacter europaeus]|uniref:tRNA (guanine-N(7)-)-methyltransferase n=1 Tax=Candidatus Liberibacter europaeus TaxID=744859 RepID=A0A2T4VYT1_9HYPH|nr:tRNA (guanosine(46)-N7)-methyltransferase TrmB [Candidatus Liberibacter europaeus]PTL86926.1 MAG: tRNA (guanosine(46)-N7)-methyltransferase TrmB [Candidatus Liberibacter europaeus]